MTGDGAFDANFNAGGFPNMGDFGDSLLRVSGNLSVVDYFTPLQQNNLAAGNLDLGSGGVAVLPNMADPSGITRSLIVGAGKASPAGVTATIFLEDRNNMGKYNWAQDSALCSAAPQAA